MRAALAIAMATLTLTLGVASRPTNGQMRTDDPPALETIRMVDRQTGWAVTELRHVGRLLRTTDGGIHWRDVTPLRPSGHKIGVWRITVLSSLIAWVVTSDTKGTGAEIFRTVDGGRTWRSAVTPSAKSISFINPHEGWLIASLAAWAGKEMVEIYRSMDGGETWTKVASATMTDNSSGLPIGGSKTAITFLNPRTGWIAGVQLQAGGFYLYVTRNAGRTWQRQTLPLLKELRPHWRGVPQPPKFFTTRDGILPVFYDILNDSGQETGRLVVFYATHDGGTTWTHTAPVRVNTSDLAYQAVVDMNHAWVVNGGILHATSDGGRRWAMMPPNPLFADVKQLEFDSPRVGWAIRQTFPFLLRTLDGGHTWTPVTYTILRQ